MCIEWLTIECLLRLKNNAKHLSKDFRWAQTKPIDDTKCAIESLTMNGLSFEYDNFWLLIGLLSDVNFQKVANPSWLFLFAPHELQYLISGQSRYNFISSPPSTVPSSSDIDLADLRKHVQYYGGFHSGHRLIKWLWQILENDFSAEERRLFLKVFCRNCLSLEDWSYFSS